MGSSMTFDYTFIIASSWYIRANEISHFQKVNRSLTIYMKSGKEIRLSEGEADGFMREFNKLAVN